MRASLRFASKKDYPLLVPALRAIYTAPTEAAAPRNANYRDVGSRAGVE
jgi:transposase-like protein